MTLLNSDKLVHSKLAGKGRCETAEEQQEVLDAIQEYVGVTTTTCLMPRLRCPRGHPRPPLAPPVALNLTDPCGPLST